MSEALAEALRACPFCSGTKFLIEGTKDGALHMSRVVCNNCGATTGYSYGDHVRRWNTRADLAAYDAAPTPSKINWGNDPEAIVDDDEPQIGRDYA